MKIFKSHTGNYGWEDYIDGQRIRKESKKWKTQKDVRKAYQVYIDSLHEEEVLADNPSMAVLIEEFSQVYAMSRKQSSVLRRKYLINAHILPYFGKIKIKSFDLRMYQRFQHELINKTYLKNGEETHYSDEHLKQIQVLFRSIITYAEQHQYIARNPIAAAPYALRNEFRPRKEFTILSNSQYEQFMSIVVNPVHRVIFSILYWCGLRSGELMALLIDDIDIDNKTMHIYKNYDTKNNIVTTTKTDKDRFVDIPDKCIDDLKNLVQYANDNNIHGNYFIVGLQKLMSKTTMDRMKGIYIERAQQKFDIPYFTFHELRHTHVSTLLDLGLDAKDIADRLGHSVEMVNNTYGHLFPKRKKELMNKLNSL